MFASWGRDVGSAGPVWASAEKARKTEVMSHVSFMMVSQW
jgi:hypothetical protein